MWDRGEAETLANPTTKVQQVDAYRCEAESGGRRSPGEDESAFARDQREQAEDQGEHQGNDREEKLAREQARLDARGSMQRCSTEQQAPDLPGAINRPVLRLAHIIM